MGPGGFSPVEAGVAIRDMLSWSRWSGSHAADLSFGCWVPAFPGKGVILFKVALSSQGQYLQRMDSPSSSAELNPSVPKGI